MQSMRVLDLFSGIGGISLGLERAGMRTSAFCEIEPYCQAVLRKHWPHVPIFDDIKQLTKQKLFDEGVITDGKYIDLICGGIPCQPFSIAGKRKGKDDDRYLWPEMFRLIREIQPNWVIVENVAHFANMALDDVLADLENEGYETGSFIIPACAVGAPHRRDRIWIVAYSTGMECEAGAEKQGVLRRMSADRKEFHNVNRSSKAQSRDSEKQHQDWEAQSAVRRVFDGLSARLDGHRWPAPYGCKQYDWEPPRVAQGVPNRTARLKALGNAVVPQIPEILGRMILY